MKASAERAMPFDEQIVVWGYASSGIFRPLDWAWEIQHGGRNTPSGIPLWDRTAVDLENQRIMGERPGEKWALPYACGPHDLVHAGGAKL